MFEIYVRGCYGALTHYTSAHLGSLAPGEARVLTVTHLKHLCPSSLLPDLSITTNAGPTRGVNARRFRAFGELYSKN